jgi:hypothetical protein
VSQLDILKFSASQYLKLGQDLANLRVNFYISDGETTDKREWTANEKAELVGFLKTAARTANALGLATSSRILEEAASTPPSTGEVFDWVTRGVEIDLARSAFCLFRPIALPSMS